MFKFSTLAILSTVLMTGVLADETAPQDCPSPTELTNSLKELKHVKPGSTIKIKNSSGENVDYIIGTDTVKSSKSTLDKIKSKFGKKSSEDKDTLYTFTSAGRVVSEKLGDQEVKYCKFGNMKGTLSLLFNEADLAVYKNIILNNTLKASGLK